MHLPIRASLLFVVCSAAATLFAQQQVLTRQDAERIALAQHPAVAAAKFSAAAQGQVPAQYRAGYLPQFSVNLTGADASDGTRIGAGALNNPVIFDRFAGGLTLSQMVMDFGRTGNLVASANLRAKAADQNTEAARAQIVLQVDQAYYALLKAKSVQRVAEETVKARQLVVDQVSALAQSMLKSTLDVSFAKVNLSEAQLTLVSAQNDVKGATARLSTALGYPATQIMDLSDEPMPPLLADDVESLVRQAIQSRPDLAGQKLEQSAEVRFSKAERALSFPAISTLASVGYIPARGADLLPSRYGAVGVNVSVPVFNGGLFRARRQEAELRAQATAQSAQDLANRIARDVRIVYLEAQTAYERVGLTAKMLDETRLALNLAQSRYDIGLSSIVELSQAQLNETSAEIAAVSAKYDFQSQRAVLAYVTGANR